jgi:hypothetical protein
MIVGVRSKLRFVCLCLLAATISLPASVRSQPASAQAAAHSTLLLDNAVLAAATSTLRPSSSEPVAICPALATPLSSASSNFSRRIFLEDTVPPSGEALKTAWLQVSMKPATPVRPESPPPRSSSTSLSNRQRAP